MRYRACALLAFLALTGCVGDSARPVATGKGAVRMINALDNAPAVGFFIEERFLETVNAQQGSSLQQWDDLEYNFNMEVNVGGELEARRIATETLNVEVDREYALLLTGAFDDPTVTVWETAEREFDGTETVFEVRFTHLSSAGSAAVYLLPEGEAPAADNALGTLASGEFLAPVDVEAGEYVLTITEAGDPAAVLYRSIAGEFGARVATTLAFTDGTSADTAPYSVQLIGASGDSVTLRDARFAPTVRLFQAAIALPDADVYPADDLVNPFVANHVFGDVTGDLAIETGSNPLTYTAVGNTSVTLLESGVNADLGRRYNLVVIAVDDDFQGINYVIDRSPDFSIARLLAFQASANHPEVDIYVVERDAGFEGTGLALSGLGLGGINTISFGPRQLDLYATTSGEDTVLAGPVPLDLELGEFVELFILDTVDPATVELRVVPAP
ncbi:MAG: DUF4397 domain-containing protein [Pseudomonadota bacterium]